jgi:hypothetical protein
MCERELDIGKPQSFCELLIKENEEALTYKLLIPKVKELKYLLSRLRSIPPSISWLSEIETELKLRSDNIYNNISGLMSIIFANSEFADKQFDIKWNEFSSNDLKYGYVEISDVDGNDYLLFLISFDNGILSVKEGTLLKDDGEARVIADLMTETVVKVNIKKNSLLYTLLNPPNKRKSK